LEEDVEPSFTALVLGLAVLSLQFCYYKAASLSEYKSFASFEISFLTQHCVMCAV
jgi:hypothetical protein